MLTDRGAADMRQTAAVPHARHATRADAARLGRALAEAFRTDPVWRWIAPDRARWDAHAQASFTADVRSALQKGHVYTTDDRAGAAMWSPPGVGRGIDLAKLRSGLAVARLLGPRRLAPGLRILQAMEKAHPRREHWYLAMLGTHPDHQGRGVGSAVLTPVLDRCDRDGTPAYLESSNPANVPFYEHHGFVVTGSIQVAGSPPIDTMWREPRPPHEVGPAVEAVRAEAR